MFENNKVEQKDITANNVAARDINNNTYINTLITVNAQLTASMNWLSKLAEYSHLIKGGIPHGHTVFFSKPG
jgi:hypothetical protein